jgi:hypothetical protein
MTVEHLEVLVEEASMEAALSVLLPKMVRDITFTLHPYDGKTDLLKRLPDRLRGYAKWLPDTYRIVVIFDRDSDDCKRKKDDLERIAAAARLLTRRTRSAEGYTILFRLAIEELEAWYFGDWIAVRTAYPKVPETIPNKAQYRDPDGITNAWETLERVFQSAGYFKGGLRKIEVARAVTEHMTPAQNCSGSFRALHTALTELMQEPP